MIPIFSDSSNLFDEIILIELERIKFFNFDFNNFFDENDESYYKIYIENYFFENDIVKKYNCVYYNNEDFVIKFNSEYYFIDINSVIPVLSSSLIMISNVWRLLNSNSSFEKIKNAGSISRIDPPKCMKKNMKFSVIGVCIFDFMKSKKINDGKDDIVFLGKIAIFNNWYGNDYLENIFNSGKLQNLYNDMINLEYPNYYVKELKLYKNAYNY